LNKNKRSKRLAIAVASAMLGLNLCTGFNSSAADGMYYGDADHNGIVDLTDLTICSQYLLRTFQSRNVKRQ
jgi:hypothetical protein